MAADFPIVDQIEILDGVIASYRKRNLHIEADHLEATRDVLFWVGTNAATIKATHAALTSPAVEAVRAAFPDAEMTVSEAET